MKLNKIFLITSLACSTILSVNLHANNNGKHEDTVTVINTKNNSLDQPLLMDKVIVNTSRLKDDAGETIAKFHHALKFADTSTARALLAENVVVFEGGGVEKSADEYAQHHMLADMKFLANINTEVIDQTIEVIGDFAYAMSKRKSSGQYQGKNINSVGLETMMLHKQAGQWKIIHIHWSN